MINILPVFSSLARKEMVEELLRKLLKEIKSEGIEVNVINETNISDNKPLAFLVLTGGTEHKILNFIDKVKGPFLLLSHNKENSFPAALEILAGLQQLNKSGKIIPVNQKKKELKGIIKIITARTRLEKSKIGLIGEPSDWLVACKINHELYSRNWGIKTIKIPVDEIFSEFHLVARNKAEPYAQEFINNSKKCVEPNFEEIIHSVRVYLAIKKIKEKYNLDGLSLRCFSLLKELKTTGCYALSKLNDDNIISGCEGDLPAALTMIWMYYLTGELPFMANPQEINIEENSLCLAHCTAGRKLLKSYIIRSHFESSRGIGIEGEMEEGKVTLARIGGKDLKKIFVTDGRIVKNNNFSHRRCRTQLKLKIEKKVNYFLEYPLGNHHVLIRGHHADLLNMYWSYYLT